MLPLKKISYCFGFVAALAAAMFFLSAAKVGSTTALQISFYHYNGVSLLQLDSTVYKNAMGQSYTVSKFRYYISNIILKKGDGTEFKANNYFLIDEDEPASKTISLTGVPEGDYTSIAFLLGVDSLHNCSGAQSGALDPVNGMFWAWNTGYIFLKLEGHADVSTSPGHIFEYHIGGYKEPSNCIRKIVIKKNLHLARGTVNKITLKADVAAILKSPNKIDFSQLSSITDFHHATTIADNYAGMFSIITP